MKHFSLLLIFILLLSGCKKDSTFIPIPSTEYQKYTIRMGEHFCDNSTITPVNLSRLSFDVKFDSTAIYTTTDPVNQYDVNKLIGFTEGIDPHINSARIGWSFNDEKLRLYAYVYNNGIRRLQELCPVEIGDDINCSIEIIGGQYEFKVNGNQLSLSRGLSTAITSGYLLFPYFGGDETAPSEINIFIKGPVIS